MTVVFRASPQTRTHRLGLVFVVLVLASALLTSCGGTDLDRQFQVDDLRLTLLPSGAKIISGSVHNASHTDVPGVLVQISLFDEDNNLLTSMTIGVEDVAAGGDTHFREPIDSDLAVDRARVKQIVIL